MSITSAGKVHSWDKIPKATVAAPLIKAQEDPSSKPGELELRILAGTVGGPSDVTMYLEKKMKKKKAKMVKIFPITTVYE